jgi:hypothetical protein
MELTSFEITCLTIMGIILIKIIHNMIRLERIHKKIKVIIEENNKILN